MPTIKLTNDVILSSNSMQAYLKSSDQLWHQTGGGQDTNVRSWTATQDCWLVITCLPRTADSAGGATVTLDGTSLTRSTNANAYCMAVKKGTLISIGKDYWATIDIATYGML